VGHQQQIRQAAARQCLQGRARHTILLLLLLPFVVLVWAVGQECQHCS
jgi:hypothetical protein